MFIKICIVNKTRFFSCRFWPGLVRGRVGNSPLGRSRRVSCLPGRSFNDAGAAVAALVPPCFLLAILRQIPPVHPDVGPHDRIRPGVAMAVAALDVLMTFGTDAPIVSFQLVVVVAPASVMIKRSPLVLMASGTVDPDRILVRELGQVVVGCAAT